MLYNYYNTKYSVTFKRNEVNVLSEISDGIKQMNPDDMLDNPDDGNDAENDKTLAEADIK